ncbi:AraC family transcriptional regulator [Thalassospira mesophila]|uniref:AraC family transcriptional regulator n=1 Tax=Thalassospira mesophila TaxID=1293891 RepID=UPI000A1F4775|nr:AraC family transcriptional regulator [Thalassospira mesophila]
MTTDPLSDALHILNARSTVSGAMKAGGKWCLQFPAPQGVKVNAAVRGGYWLLPDARDALPDVWIEEGDVVLFNGCHGFVMASEKGLPVENAHAAYRDSHDNSLVLGDGQDCFILGLHVRLDPDGVDFLTGVLPKMVRIRARDREAAILQWLLEQMIDEKNLNQPGKTVASNQLAQLMFVQVLRTYIANADAHERGWLQAIGDPHIGASLRHIHANPAHAWTLAELAEKVAMSRTNFALQFRTKVGMPPLTYLQGWRMRLARRALRERDIPVSSLALELGYLSESAFSNAFKRHTGLSPRQFRLQARPSQERPHSDAGNPQQTVA